MLALRSSAAIFRPGASSVRHHTGYIAYEGRLGYTENDQTRLISQSKALNLQPLKKITFSFDPFRPEVKGIRDVMFSVSHKKCRASNPKCAVKTEILSDGSQPLVKLEFADNVTAENGVKRKPLVFRAATMTGLEMLYEMNRILLPLIKEKEEEAVGSKAAKLMGAGKKK